MRTRITFAKTEAMRYTSHLDLYRTWERTLRRAGLPLAYSQGFKPHPHINLASALPLGFTSDCEVVDIWLEEELSLQDIESSLKQASPPGLVISQVEQIEDRAPTLQTQLLASEFLVTLLERIPDLDACAEELLRAESLPRERRGKAYDLRPLILEFRRWPENGSGHQRFVIRLSAQEGATGRPEEVILALGGNQEAARVHRTRLIFQSDS